MNRPAKAQEPSMDEILASIRRIIADDDAAKAQTGHAPESLAPAAPPSLQATSRGPAITSSGLRPPFSARPSAANPGGLQQESPSHEEDNSVSTGTRFDPASGREFGSAREFGARFSADASDTPPAAASNAPAAANASFPPVPNYAPASNPQPAPTNYQPAPAYHPAASAPASLHSEPPPPVFRDSGGHGMEPAILRTHEESRRNLAQSAVEQALLSTTTSAAVDSAFGMLTHQPAPQHPVAHGTRSIEDLVGDMLRPMLKNWLDDNLPSLVERLVRAEIERVSRGR